jgi:SNF2 family DNA or RNA helicase
LLLEINKIISDPSTRIIIFSQWDNMLNLISRILTDNKFNNSFIKGNANFRNSSIEKFNNDTNDNKIIMLSLKNSASGTNLNKATHIFFMDPINNTLENIKNTELQAIGRGHRIGQKQSVKIIRILTKDTVEEEIYNEKYKNNT